MIVKTSVADHDGRQDEADDVEPGCRRSREVGTNEAATSVERRRPAP